MGLAAALDSLPNDRATQQAVREVLLALSRHPDQAVSARRVADLSGESEGLSRRVLDAFARCRVVTRDEEPDTFRYSPDRLTALDVDRFVRRVDARTGMLQDNVERFRERFGR